jgi:ATP-dependent protease ClpP protease subunit
MAGDDIIMPKNCVDDDSQSVGGGCCGESEDMRTTADLLDKFRDQLAGIYSQREPGRRLADVLAAMAAETWMTGDEAHRRLATAQ